MKTLHAKNIKNIQLQYLFINALVNFPMVTKIKYVLPLYMFHEEKGNCYSESCCVVLRSRP